MIKRRSAFTLIELMVVVAIIAILASMGVANFSSAIRRARNATRQADILAVSKALETCYNAMTGIYIVDSSGNNALNFTGVSKKGNANTDSAFSTQTNGCLNSDITPAIDEYDYAIITNASAPQRFVVCARLEQVGGWESIGNVAGDGPVAETEVSKYSSYMTNSEPVDFPKNCTADSENCYFCVANQQ